jgi:hypothetical protein
MATAITREYNPSTGKVVGNISELKFGHVPIGKSSAVKVIDLVVEGVTSISNVNLQVVSSSSVPVNDSPTGIVSDGSASNGNLGIEHDSDFIPRRTLSRFFAGESSPVAVGSRSGNVSEYVFLNVKMNATSTGSGKISYQWIFDVS